MRVLCRAPVVLAAAAETPWSDVTPPPPPRKADAAGSAGALAPRTLPFSDNPLFAATPERPPLPPPPERTDSLVDVPLSPMLPPPQQQQQARVRGFEAHGLAPPRAAVRCFSDAPLRVARAGGAQARAAAERASRDAADGA